MNNLRKHEIFHIIIFSAVFLYFIILKLTDNLDISWFSMLVPLYVSAFFYILVKLLKQYYFKKK